MTINVATSQNQSDPYISEPPDISYIEGATGNYIEWYVSFDTPLHYSIQRNNTIVRVPSGDLGSNSGNITICVDGLSPGIWHYVLIVDDYEDNVETDHVVVTVHPSIVPILLNPLILPVFLTISIIMVFSVWWQKKS